MKIDYNIGPAPAVGSPAGAIGACIGSGKGKLDNGSGAGMDVSSLKSEVEAIFSDVSKGATAGKKARSFADAIHKFCLTLKVTTNHIGVVSGGASTVVPPAFTGTVSNASVSGSSIIGSLS